MSTWGSLAGLGVPVRLGSSNKQDQLDWLPVGPKPAKKNRVAAGLGDFALFCLQKKKTVNINCPTTKLENLDNQITKGNQNV